MKTNCIHHSQPIYIGSTETLHKQRVDLDLVRCCVGELCTINRNGIPWPMVYGVGVDVNHLHVRARAETDISSLALLHVSTGSHWGVAVQHSGPGPMLGRTEGFRPPTWS